MTTNKIAPIYGYAVCLVSIIATFIAIGMIVNAVFNYADPLHANDFSSFQPRDLSSYEAYKLNATELNGPEKNPAAPTSQLSEDEMKKAYEAAKAEKTASVKFNARKSMTNGAIVLLFAVILFFSHWKWLSRLHRDGVQTV